MKSIRQENRKSFLIFLIVLWLLAMLVVTIVIADVQHTYQKLADQLETMPKVWQYWWWYAIGFGVICVINWICFSFRDLKRGASIDIII